MQSGTHETAHQRLAYLEEGTPEFDNYLTELHWAQRFAWLNREEMMDRFGRCLREWIGRDVAGVERINCHHNYTVEEEHYGEKVWLTRKGAVLADAEPWWRCCTRCDRSSTSREHSRASGGGAGLGWGLPAAGAAATRKTRG